MPGYLTEHVHDELLDYLFGGRALAGPPSTLYAGLSLARACRGGAVVEPRGGGYARAPIVNDPSRFPAASAGRKSNAGPIAFNRPSGDWGLVRSVFLADAAEGGRVLAMADLPEPRLVVASGPSPTIRAGGLVLSHA